MFFRFINKSHTILKLAFMPILVLLLVQPATAFSELDTFYARTLTFSSVYNIESASKGIEADFNTSNGPLNVGYSLRTWGSDVQGWRGMNTRFEGKAYIGFGYMQLLQAQFGISTSGRSLCIRSYIYFPQKDKPDKTGIVVSPFYEIYNNKHVAGLGVGVSYR